MDTSAFSIIPHRGLRISIAAKQAAANPDPTFDANFQVGTIIWTVVNAALALLMTARIIYVSIKRHQLSYSQGEVTSQHRTLIAKIFKKNQWNTCLWRGFKITTEDVFPLLLATMIAIQEIIYLYAETRDIDGRKEMMPGCKQVTEVVWGAVWVTPMLVLVFSLECLATSFVKPGFPPRSRNTLIFCISSTIALTAVICIALKLSKTDNGLCSGHVIFSMSQHGPGGLGLASALIPIWAAIVIGLWSNMVDNTDAPAEQRIAAIKVGTYTILAALQMTFIIPYFATATVSTVNKTTLFIAEVALKAMGVVCFIAQHFLDSYGQKLLSQAAGDPEKATPGSSGPPQEHPGTAVDGSTPMPQGATADAPRATNTPHTIRPTPSHKSFTSHFTTVQIQIRQLGQKLVTKLVTTMSPQKELARSTSPSGPHQLRTQAQTSRTPPNPTSTRTPTTPQPRPLPSPTTSPHTSPRKPRPLPPLPLMGLATSTPHPVRPSPSNVPPLYHIEDLAVRAMIMPPRVVGRKEKSRALTPILERPVPPPMERAQAPEWYQ